MGNFYIVKSGYPMWGIYVFFWKKENSYEVCYVGRSEPERGRNFLSQSIFGRLDKHLTGGDNNTSDLIPNIRNIYNLDDIEILKRLSFIFWLPSAELAPNKKYLGKKVLKKIEDCLINELKPKCNDKNQEENEEPRTFSTLEEAKKEIERIIMKSIESI